METETKQVIGGVLEAKEGFAYYHKDDTEFESPSKRVYLGKEASPDDWVEVEEVADAIEQE